MSDLNIPLGGAHVFANGAAANASAWSMNLNFRECVAILGGTIRCDEDGKGDDEAAEDRTEYLDDAAGDLDDTNFKRISEKKFLFDNAGHDHDGVASTAVTDTPEDNVTWDNAGGHTHDDTDSEKLALANENAEQGALKVKYADSQSIAYNGNLEIDLEAAGFAELFSVKVWLDEAGGESCSGVGGMRYYGAAAPYSIAGGFYWTLSGDDHLTLTIYSEYIGGLGNTDFSYMVIGK